MKPQQNKRSIKQLESLSPSGRSCFFCSTGFWRLGDAELEPSCSLSLASSSSITNCGEVDVSLSPGSSGTSAALQNTSSSNSLSDSKTTGKTRWSVRRQFKTSLVVFRLPAPVLDLMNEDAYEVTEVGGVGNVWSDTRLKRLDVTTRMSVATFSGASIKARRTAEK